MKLVIVLNAAHLEVSLYRRDWRGWYRAEHATLPWRLDSGEAPLLEQLPGTLRPCLLAWGVPPGCRVLAVPDAASGGLLQAPRSKTLAPPEQEAELLASQLPYPAASLAICSQAGPADQLRLCWIAASELQNLRTTLDKLGMRLQECYPAAQLLAQASPASRNAYWLWCQASQLIVWRCDGAGIPITVASLSTAQTGWPQRLSLLLASLGHSEGAPVLHSGFPAEQQAQLEATLGGRHVLSPQAPPDLSQQVFSHWLAGARGWWQPPSRDWLVSRFTPWAAAVGLLLVAGMGGLHWQQQNLRAETDKLNEAADKMQPAHKRLQAKRRELLTLREQLLAAESFVRGPALLDALALSTPLLPDGSWLTRYRHDGKQVLIAGEGASQADMQKRLKPLGLAPLDTGKPAPTIDPPKQFSLEFHVRKPAQAS
ncbi:hypothetical protein GCM10007907_07250 [Chitinimonas prasina]|uniref:PilN domain-containing protein n=1 Tax=Chitinimonas prasina TaxID=1434937 RepID=A0ABQ5YF00_9NEIS|nr:hypothetical protein [Chitinimonas prasina]GLR11935.1 hypothetical protein GCM10007907_07250 [Chitinimonas prasina]